MSSHSPDTTNRNGPIKGPAATSSRRKQRRESKRRGGEPPQTRPATAASGESVASLLRRLGTPPPDLAARLVLRFKDGCRQCLAGGGSIAAVDLNSWAINRDGDLVFTGEILPADQGTSDIEELTAEFQQRLSAPRPAIARRRVLIHSSNQSRLRVDQISRGSAERYGQRAADETQTSTLSVDEQARREKLVAQFSASLANRFGQEAIAPPVQPVEKIRSSKPQPMSRDRRFNWNLVLGVGTAAAVIAMIWTGIQITHIRARRAEDRGNQVATVDRSAELSVLDTTNDAKSVKKQENSAAASIDLPPDDMDQDERFEFTVNSVVGKERDRGGFDIMDDLDALLASSGPDAANMESASVDVSGDPVERLEIERPARTPNDSLGGSMPNPGSPVFSGDDTAGDNPGDDSLQSAFDVDPPEQDAVEVPQATRPSQDRFVELPPAGTTEAQIVIDQTGASIDRIKFPSPVPIVLSATPDDGTWDLINQQSGNRIAQLRRKDDSTVLQWSETASKDTLSQKLLHGRVVLSGGESVYLRPSIETDAYPISLKPREMRPSWTLGAPLLPEVSRLEIDLTVPESIDLAWHTPFNSKRPHHGTAIAILTPTDGETVAIAVRLDVDCSRKLTCRLRYGARLSPSMDWSPLSEASFASETALLSENLHKLQMQRGLFEQRYNSAGTMERKIMGGQGEKIDADIKRVKAIQDRLILLGKLAILIQQSVKLELHLSVQWPDATQTLLRTASKTASRNEVE